MARAADPKNSPPHWYHEASPEDRAEYDAYGPRIVEVKDEADMPPCFGSFYPADKDARILPIMHQHSNWTTSVGLITSTWFCNSTERAGHAQVLQG